MMNDVNKNLNVNTPSNEEHKSVDYNDKVLEVKNLKRYFRVGVGKNKLTIPAVDNVTFDVYKREVFGLVGESGSGKTTTGRTLIKLYNPTEGTVDLNGIRVAAGYMEFVNNIKKIKKQLNKDILALDERKEKINKIKVERDKEIKKLEFKLQDIKHDFKVKLEETNAPIIEYTKELYNLQSQLRLDLESYEYDFILEKDEIVKSTKNEALAQLDYELAIEKNKLRNQVEGLKESAALSKETIQKQIKKVNDNFEKTVAEIKAKYEALIEEGKSKIVDKKVAKEKINAAKALMKEKIAARKEIEKENVSKVIVPDYESIKIAITQITENYKFEKEQIKKQIAELEAQAKDKIAQVPKSNETLEAKMERIQKIRELKAEAKVKIKEQKDKIFEAKQINSSRDALLASRKMQMIFQDPISSLNPRMTVREIVGEGLKILGGFTKEEIDARVAETLKIVGLLPEYATRYPHEFSGGQRQRIGIARALIMNPNFIIADEPISALDVSIRAQVINLLSQLKEELDLTILFIAHDLSVVRFFCDRIAVMYAGKIVELAESEELFKFPMHSYTKSLLSAIPQPDPDFEKGRRRINYDPTKHNYRFSKPSLREIRPNHFVFANDEEFEAMKTEYAKLEANVKANADSKL